MEDKYPCDSCPMADSCDVWEAKFCCTLCAYYGMQNCDDCDPNDIQEILTLVMDELEEIIAASPDNFVIRNALIKCYEVVHEHNKIVCSVSGGATVM